MYKLLLLFVLQLCYTNAQSIDDWEFSAIEQKLLERIRIPAIQLIDAFLKQQGRRLDELETLMKELNRTLALKADKCTPGWTLNVNKCYKAVSKRVSYADALADCKTYRATLATPVNENENGYVFSLTTDIKKWIGVIDRTGEKNFVVESTNQSIIYSKCGDGEPNNHKDTNEDCVELWGDEWNDAPCGVRLPYICEKNSL